MKRILLLCVIITLISKTGISQTQNVGIGTLNPDPSSLLELYSTDKGMLIPRISDTMNVSSPATGLLIYLISNNTFYYFDGVYWRELGSVSIGPTGPQGPAGAIGTTGAAGTNGLNGVTGATGPTGLSGTNGINGTTGPTGPAGSDVATHWTITGNAGTTPATNFLGTTDPNDLVFKTNNSERIRIGSSGSSIGSMGINTINPNRMTNPTDRALTIESTSGSHVELMRITSSSGAEIGSLNFDRIASANGIITGRAAIYGETVNGNDATRLKFHTMPAGGSLSPRMTITDSGNVGIGTTNPAYKFVVEAATGQQVAVGQTLGNEWGIGMVNTGTLRSTLFYSILTSPPSLVVKTKFAEPIHFVTNDTNRMTIASGGNVGIGTSSPTEALHIVGNVCYTGTAGACSDIRYKKDIKPLPDALKNVLLMNGISYYWKKEEYPAQKFPETKQIGFIAQEMEKLYPEVILTDDKGYKSVDYSRLTPVLVEAIKDINAEIQQMKKEYQNIIEKQQLEISNLSGQVQTLESKILNQETSNFNQIK